MGPKKTEGLMGADAEDYVIYSQLTIRRVGRTIIKSDYSISKTINSNQQLL